LPFALFRPEPRLILGRLGVQHDPPDDPVADIANIVIVIGPMAAGAALVGADKDQHLPI
jgi:hypothetical protein